MALPDESHYIKCCKCAYKPERNYFSSKGKKINKFNVHELVSMKAI